MDVKDFVEGLRQIADWYEANSDVVIPEARLTVFGEKDNKKNIATLAWRLGPLKKEMNEEILALERSFNGVALRFVFLRSAVCERRVVRTEEIPEAVIPAHTREIVEWDCHALLDQREDNG
jgi:hypothetical protein